MEPRDIVVIGGSAGAIEALSRLVGHLPRRLDAALFVVVHTAPAADSLLPAILSRRGSLMAVEPADGDPIACDRIYVAPPDCHMIIEAGRIRISSGPKESLHRPAIDPLFRSAARSYQARVVGVVLSGMLDDGSRGLAMIRRRGGTAMVQDPGEALFPQMPRNAIEAANPQHVGTVDELARLIAIHTRGHEQKSDVEEFMSDAMNPNGGKVPIGADDVPGTPTGIACPECHGVIWAADELEEPEYRCRIGHAYTTEALAQAHADSVEGALWAAVRALQERASLTKHLGHKAQRRGDHLTAGSMMEQSNTADRQATTIESMLLSRAEKSG